MGRNLKAIQMEMNAIRPSIIEIHFGFRHGVQYGSCL